MVLEKTLESPLDHRGIKPVNPKGNQSRVFIGTLMLKLKLQYFGDLMQTADSLEIGKDSAAGKDGKQEDEMIGWHHRLDGHEF